MSEPYPPQNPGQPTPPPPGPQSGAPQYGAPQYPSAPQFPSAPQYSAPQYSAPQYGAPAYGAGGPTGKTPGLAIAGLILAFVAAPVGLILSLVALPKAKRAGAGRGVAIAGAIIGALGTIAAIVALVFVVRLGGQLAQPALAVTNFNQALEDRDCQKFLDTTTQGYQELAEVSDCATFAQYADEVTAGTEDYTVSISGMSAENGVTVISTTETYTLTDGGSQESDTYDYTMVQEGGAWKVDSVDLTS